MNPSIILPTTPGASSGDFLHNMWNRPVTINRNNFVYKSLSCFSFNHAVGCDHGCVVCFVPSTTANKQASRLEPYGVVDPDAEWGSYVMFRPWDEKDFLRSLNAAENTPISELNHDGNRAVMYCTTTDPYQVVRHPDRKRRSELYDHSRFLIRRSLELIRDRSTINVRILTRSPLARLDFDLFRSFGNRLTFGMSLPTLRNDLLAVYEPNAPAPTQRLATLHAAKKAGLHVYVAIAPTYAECGASDIEATMRAVKDLDPLTVFHEPVNIRAKNVARIEASAAKLGVPLNTGVFANLTLWRDYARKSLSTAWEIGHDLGIQDRLHLWPDASLGTKTALQEVDNPVGYHAWLSAAKILGSAGFSVIEAARLVASLTEKLKPFGKAIADAVDYFVERHLGKQITVSALVKMLIEQKKLETGHQNVKDLRSKLESTFCRSFGERLIRSLEHAELGEWINRLPGGLRKKRNHHAAIVTLMGFAKELGYLPKDQPTEIELIKKKKTKKGPKVLFTPDELRAMIRAGLVIKSPALLSLLIQCLAGVRHEEIEQTDPDKDRLRMNDIYLNQPLPEIHIRQEVAKNGEERWVPIVPELVAWIRALAPELFKDGESKPPADPLYSRLSLYKDYLRIAAAAGIRWKKNGPRKSFNTYDSALSGSLQLTAKSAGNSPQMIERYYKKQVSQAGLRALDWFSISPEAYLSLIPEYITHLKAHPPKIGKRGPRKKKDKATVDPAPASP